MRASTHAALTLTATSEPSHVSFRAQGVTRTLPGGRVIHHNISFTVSSGETIFVVGPSGVGKSLLLRSLAYLGVLCRGCWWRRRRVGRGGG